MDNARTFTIDQHLAGQRLDRTVADLMDGMSRTRARRLIEEGCVTVNGGEEKASASLHPGDRVVVHPPAAATLPHLEPEAIPLDLVYEDDTLLVVNKPQGLVVHPAPGHERGTLVHALLHHTRGQLSAGGAPERPGIVHRLDRFTSGLLVVAKTPAAHGALAEQLADRDMRREYLAVVWGAFEETGGTIDAPIGRSGTDRKRMAVPGIHSRSAVTHFTVKTPFTGATELALRLETGRTHQVRLHCAYIGHGLIGDPTYGKPPPRRALPWPETLWQAMRELPGQLLHARTLGFTHPGTGDWMEWQVDPPQVYRDFRAALAACGEV